MKGALMSNTTAETKTTCSDCKRLLNTEEAAAPNICKECSDIICDICVFGCKDMRKKDPFDIFVCSDCFIPCHDMHPDHHLWVKAEPHQEAWLKAWDDGEADTFKPLVDVEGLALIKGRLKEWWAANNSNSDIQEDDTGDGKSLIVDNTWVISRDQRIFEETKLLVGGVAETVNGYVIEVIISTPGTRLDPPEEDYKELGFYKSEAEVFHAVVMEMFEDHVDGFIVQWQTEEEEKTQAEWEKMCDEWDESLDVEKTAEPEPPKEE